MVVVGRKIAKKNKKVKMKKGIIAWTIVLILLSSCSVELGDTNSSPKNNIVSTDIPNANQIPKPTNTLQLTPTPKFFQINSNFPEVGYLDLLEVYDEICQYYSIVSLEDITSGKLLGYEQDYISGNIIFCIQPKKNKIEIKEIEYSSNHGTFRVKLVNVLGAKDSRFKPENRPLRIISYYIFQDEELFSSLGIDPIKNDGLWFNEKWPFWVITWAYHNPDGTVTLGHSLVEIFDYAIRVDVIKNSKYFQWRDCKDCEFGGTNFKPAPEFLYYDVNIEEGDQIENNHLTLYRIHQAHPETLPDEAFINNWVSTGVMPAALQLKLFGLDTSRQLLDSYNFWAE